MLSCPDNEVEWRRICGRTNKGERAIVRLDWSDVEAHVRQCRVDGEDFIVGVL